MLHTYGIGAEKAFISGLKPYSEAQGDFCVAYEAGKARSLIRALYSVGEDINK
jgi:hypothetical protein